MSARLARLALALYPLAYRRRYGEEMEDLLEDSGSSPRVIADILRAALAAHLSPASAVADEIGDCERMRLGMGSILLCWVFFAAAGFGLYKTTEGAAYSHAGDMHRLIGGAHLAIQVLATLATAAVVIGAAPLVLAALRQGRERFAARRAAILAAGCAVSFVMATAALVAVADAKPAVSSGVAAATLGAWCAFGLGCGLGCVIAARRGLAVVEVRRSTLRRTMLAADGVALAMLGIAIAAAIYLAALLAGAPDLAARGNGPLGLTSVAVSLALQLGVMFLAAAAATLSACRTRAFVGG